MYRTPGCNTHIFGRGRKPDVFGSCLIRRIIFLLERNIQKDLQAVYHTVVSHSRNQNPCVFSVEVHGPAPAVIQIKAGHSLHLASLFHQPLGNGAAKEWGWSTLEPNPVDLFIRQSPFWGVQMVAVGRLKRQHSEQQRKRLMNFLSAGPFCLLHCF